MPDETPITPDENETTAPVDETTQVEADEVEADEDEAAEDDATEDGLPANTVTIEDAGASAKKITIEISRERIDAKFDEIFGELRTSAQVPGFRIGRAPRRLLEKRFGKEAGEDVRNGLVSAALGEAVEENELQIIGEPDIKLDEIELPDTGPLTFSLEVEVAPEFDMPEYENIPVAEASIEVTDDRIAATTKDILSSRGVLAPTEEPAAEGDHIIADVKITGEGIDESRDNAEFLVAPGATTGIPMEDLAAKLTGSAAGKTVTLEATVPDTHETEDWRGKAVTIAMEIKEVKRLEVPEMSDELAAEFGMDNAEAFIEFVKERLGSQLQTERQESMRQQIAKYLLDNAAIDLPEGLAARQTARVLQRRYVDLLYRGVPREQIDQNLEMLKAQAGSQATDELKLGFILDKVAEAEDISVEEGEVNSRIAEMASRSGRRPERLRSEMTNQGTLGEVEVQIREQKAIDKLLEMADVKPAEPAKAEDPKPAEKAAKNTAKKKDETQDEKE